jgi:Novel toxin 10
LNSMGCLKLDYYEDLQVRTCVPMLSGEAKMVLCWLSVDPLAERGPQYSPYCFTMNNPMNMVDPDGRWPFPTWSNVKQYYSGMWQGAKQTYKATANAIAHPIETAKRIYNSPTPKQDIADRIGGSFGMAGQVITPAIRSTLQALSGDYKGAGKTNGAALADASIQGATLAVGAVAGKGLSLLTKGATISNTVPSTLARVIPADIQATTLGVTDRVFVTASSEISGMNATQIATKLTIPESASGFNVIEFPTPSTGIASPIVSEMPGFIGGGKTAGGAVEFTIPNQPIPANATINTVK